MQVNNSSYMRILIVNMEIEWFLGLIGIINNEVKLNY
jgi:hypothetical protein